MHTPMSFDALVDYTNEHTPFDFDWMQTHGFLVASVVGMPLDDWQAVLFDGYDAPNEAYVVALRCARAKILDELKNEETVSLPFLLGEEAADFGEDSDIAAWCTGFIDGMYAHEDAWFSDDNEEDLADLTLPMVVFSGLGWDDCAQIYEDDDLLADLANSIEDNVVQIFLLFNTDE